MNEIANKKIENIITKLDKLNNRIPVKQYEKLKARFNNLTGCVDRSSCMNNSGVERMRTAATIECKAESLDKDLSILLYQNSIE